MVRVVDDNLCFPFRRCRTERLWLLPPWRCWWSHGWWAGHQEGWWSSSNCRNSQLGYLCQVCTEEYMSTGECPFSRFVLIPSAQIYPVCLSSGWVWQVFLWKISEEPAVFLSCDSAEDCSLLAKHRDKQCSRIRCCSMQGLQPLCFGNSTGLMSKEGSAGSGMLRCVLKAKRISTRKTDCLQMINGVFQNAA